MQIFEQIALERRQVADLIAGLDETQLATQSLCDQWTVRDVAGHLIVPLQVSLPRFGLAMLTARGSFDRANASLARQQARRPIAEIADILRAKADHRFTPPGYGPEAPLTDLLVHSLDITRPLDLQRPVPAESATAALDFLASGAAKSFVADGVLDGLRLAATDLDWSRGSGPLVSGSTADLLLTITGRTVVTDLSGDGVATITARLTR